MGKNEEAQKIIDETITDAAKNPYLAESIQQRVLIPIDNTSKILFDNNYCENVCKRPCCKGKREIPLLSLDIFNIVTSKEGQQLGYKSTDTLFKPKVNLGKYFYFNLGAYSHIPVCAFLIDQQCPFFNMQKGHGICLLGENRPTVCQARPISRIVNKDTDFYYYSPFDCCEGSRLGVVNNTFISLPNFMEQRKLHKRYAQTQQHHNILYLFEKIQDETDKIDIMCKLFNPDYFVPKKMRPIFKTISYEEHMNMIKQLIENKINHQV